MIHSLRLVRRSRRGESASVDRARGTSESPGHRAGCRQDPNHRGWSTIHLYATSAFILNAIQVARTSIGVLTTENRKTWSRLRQALAEDRTNAACLRLIDDALFIVCLDDAAPAREGAESQRNSYGNASGEDLAALCSNFLCGTYDLREGVQVGTCTNRWYDKVCVHVP